MTLFSRTDCQVNTITAQAFELILADDGSTDKSLEIAQSYAAKDSRIRVLSHENMGMGQTLNGAMNQAAHEWIARLDADDLMVPDRLDHQVAFLQDHQEVDVLASYVQIIDEHDSVISIAKSPFISHERLEAQPASGGLIGFHHPSVIMKKKSVQTSGGYRSQFWPADDIDLWNRMLDQGFTILVQPEFLTQYRIHENSVSISSALNARQKVGWLKVCMVMRRQELPEPDWDEFCRLEAAKPALSRLNTLRKDYAKVYYKAAGLQFAKKHFCTSMAWAFFSLFLQPSYFIRKRILNHL